MNFVLIPFFLAASVTVNDPNEWRHGPEFVYRANLTYLLSTDLSEEPFFRTNLTTILNCRPKSPVTLYCRFGDVVMEALHEEPPQKVDIEHPFLIRFNQRGIESLHFPEVIENEKLLIVRSIVKEMSIGADLRHNSLPAFVTMENSVLGDCATMFTVLEYGKDEGPSVHEQRNERKYDLNVLSFPRMGRDSTVVVDKRTEPRRCVNKVEWYYGRDSMDFEIKKSISKMSIRKGSFRSQTEIYMKMKSNTLTLIQNIASLELTAIEPANEELPSTSFDEIATIRFGEEMQHNFLM